MDTNEATAQPAPVGQVECQVRPRAWALAVHPRFGGGDYLRSEPTTDGGPWEPLYDQLGLAAAVAAEGERWAAICRGVMAEHGGDPAGQMVDYGNRDRLLAQCQAAGAYIGRGLL